MGLIVVETCSDCGHVGVPKLDNSDFKFSQKCRKCDSSNFVKPELQNTPKFKCRKCKAEYPFTDLGCPYCFIQHLESLGVKPSKIL